MGFEVFEGKDKQWRFRFRARNGETILQSEGYWSKRNATRGADCVTKNILKDPKVRVV